MPEGLRTGRSSDEMENSSRDSIPNFKSPPLWTHSNLCILGTKNTLLMDKNEDVVKK